MALLLGLAALAGPGVAIAQATASTPGVTFGEAPLMTPTQAANYYAGEPSTVTYNWAATRPPEIVETARSLNNDPDQIFAFVRNNIRIIPIYGMQKGALGALTDRSGTAFDQAHLMVELLRAAGFSSARYVLGEVTLTGDQVQDWLGTKSRPVVAKLLANGAIPAELTGDPVITGAVIGHVWVQVEVAGTTRTYDAAFKASERFAGIDAKADSGLNTTSFVTTALGTATVSSESGVSYVKSVNVTGAESALATAGSALLGQLKTTHKEKADEEIVGGSRIVFADNPAATPTTGVLTPRLTFTGGMPDRFRTKLSVAAADCSASFFVDEIYARRLTLHRQIALYTPVSGIYLDGTLVGATCGSGGGIQNLAVTVGVQHPYAALSGAYMDTTAVKIADWTTDIVIVHGWGDTGGGLQAKLAKETSTERDEKIPDPVEGPMPDGSQFVQSDSGTTMVGPKTKAASSWLNQTTRLRQLLEGVSDTWFLHHHSIGISYSQSHYFVYDTDQDGVVDPGETFLSESPRDSAMRLDIDSGLSTISLLSSSADEIAARHTLAAGMATLEGSVMEQQLDAVDVSSTAQRLPWAQENLASTIRFHLFPAGASAPGVTTYRAGQSASGQACVGSQLTTQGFTVLQANDRSIGPGQANPPPSAWSTTNPWLGQTDSTMHRGCAWIAFKADGSHIAHVVTSLDRALKGGGAGTDAKQQEQFKPEEQADLLKDKFKDRSSIGGVDLRTGALTYTPAPDLVVGQGDAPYSLTFQRTFQAGGQRCAGCPFGWTHNYDIRATLSGGGMEGMGQGTPFALAGPLAALEGAFAVYRDNPNGLKNQLAGAAIMRWYGRQLSDNVVTVNTGPSSESFVRLVDGSWAGPRGSAATLTRTGQRRAILEAGARSKSWKYDEVAVSRKGPTGDVLSFQWREWNPSNERFVTPTLYPKAKQQGFFASTWTFPRGATLTFTYCESQPLAPQQDISTCRDRLTRVTSSLGPYLDIDRLQVTSSDGRSTLVTIPDTASSSNTEDWQSDEPTSFTDVAGQVWKYEWRRAGAGDRPSPYPMLARVYAPGEALPITEFAYDKLGNIKSVKDAEAIRGRRAALQFRTPRFGYGSATDPMGGVVSIAYDEDDKPIRQTDELGRTSRTIYNGVGQVYERIAPEGDKVRFTYNDRGQVTELRRIPKPGYVPALADIVITAGWDPTWNKPAWIVDALGNQMDFAYVASGNGAGELLSLTRPAPVSGAPRPVYSFTYNAAGQVADSTDPTGVVTRRTYGANGYLATTVLDPTGVNAITTLTTNTRGDVTATNGPRTDVTDITYATYDLLRRKVFDISADPDGTGPLIRMATKSTYDPQGRVILVEKGKTASTVGGGFLALSSTATTYDSVGSPIRVVGPAGVTDTSYDGNGRKLCVAVRMNAAGYGSLPDDACVLSAPGADGPDRITRTVYDAAGQVISTIDSYGLPNQRTYATYSYTLNGQQATIQDSRGNRTTQQYDGFDRLCRMSFPVPTVGAQASATPSIACRDTAALATDNGTTGDFEEYRYDAAGKRSWIRRRDGQVIAFSYDALGRETLKDIPGGTVDDVHSAYDSAGRLTSSLLNGVSGQGTTITYDTAGRMLTETMFGKALSYQYDKAGNRTRLTWPDAFYAQWTYDALNRPTTISENGATSGLGVLAAFTYDDWGRHIGLIRGNGTTTTYGYDVAGRLTGIVQDLAATAYDQTYSFDYNPASQIKTRITTNPLFAWTPPSSGFSTSNTYDGLNRDAAIVALPGGYDPKGNLTGDGIRTFTYDVENRLVSVGGPSGLTLGYDALGRLRQTTGTVTAKFLYDGPNLVAEYDAADNLISRYVHGPNIDEPLVWYDGSGSANRQWLHADWQGSIIALSGDAGAATQIYAYGPWGEPKDDLWAGSRFRFTGQIVLPEAKLYHHKARVYDPEAGRFLQTDPVGNADDLNLYAYVGGDPVNYTDPEGEQRRPARGTGTAFEPPVGPAVLNAMASNQLAAIQRTNPQYRSPAMVYAAGQPGYYGVAQYQQFVLTNRAYDFIGRGNINPGREYTGGTALSRILFGLRAEPLNAGYRGSGFQFQSGRSNAEARQDFATLAAGGPVSTNSNGSQQATRGLGDGLSVTYILRNDSRDGGGLTLNAQFKMTTVELGSRIPRTQVITEVKIRYNE